MAIKEVVVHEGIAEIMPSPATPVLSSQPGPSCADSKLSHRLQKKI